MDENEYIYYRSRSKELIIRGGVNVYPVIDFFFLSEIISIVLISLLKCVDWFFLQAEVERFLRTNEKIVDCYAVGVPDERVGEELCVWIKLKHGQQMTADEVKEFCKGKIAYFKVPRYVKFVDSFPINATGKVQKFKMQEQMAKDLKP